MRHVDSARRVNTVCMIQDDMSNYESKSKKVSAVYGNSKVKIAVVKSKDGEGRCFVEDDPAVGFKLVYSTLNKLIALRKCYSHYR